MKKYLVLLLIGLILSLHSFSKDFENLHRALDIANNTIWKYTSYEEWKNCVLKFRTDARMRSWGFGGYIKMDENENLLVIIYPMFPKYKRERIMVDQLFLIMKNVLGV
jgi:hypothetical protein